MKYLGIEIVRPRVAVFDFTGCEGCELQFANGEGSLADFLKLVEIVNFREVSSLPGDDYDVAFIDGAISRNDEVERIKAIRERAKLLVAMGSCACFGGVHRMKNACDLREANREVYGDKPKETLPVRAVREVVKVDLELPGCPVSKREIEQVIRNMVLSTPYRPPVYPVCYECKHRFTTCTVDLGEFCLGPITRAGCDAPCPAGGLGCWGCRGPVVDCNLGAFLDLVRERGFMPEEIEERLRFFGGFEGLQ